VHEAALRIRQDVVQAQREQLLTIRRLRARQMAAAVDLALQGLGAPTGRAV
jgi:hypothetical protein